MSIVSTMDLFAPLILPRGPSAKNRLVLAPLTNTQSNADGTLSGEELHWLTQRARGGFGLVTTCASHVQANGQGFPGQLACYGDQHVAGLTRLAAGLHEAGACSSLQLQHSGMRALAGIENILGPSDDAKTGAKAMSTREIDALIEAFEKAAKRAELAGFNGVQIHAAHGYIITQFLSPELNRRSDGWGGSFENRSRLLFQILERIRHSCGASFQIGIRLSPERFGLRLVEMVQLAQRLLQTEDVDYLDLSLWDIDKEPEDAEFRGESLLTLFTRLERGRTKIGVAGKIMSGSSASRGLAMGADYVAIGRAAILAHDFPRRVREDPGYVSPSTPISVAHLRSEGLGEAFIDYMKSFSGFVASR